MPKRTKQQRHVFPGADIYRGKRLRHWASAFLKDHKLPEKLQGKHQKIPSLLDDESTKNKCLHYLRKQNPDRRSPINFSIWLENTLQIKIHEKTARRWMQKMGFNYREVSSGAYVDGHERDDVKTDRIKFLLDMEDITRRMDNYEGDDMMTLIPAQIHPGESKYVFFTYDESSFSANNTKGRIWIEDNKNIIRPKGDGSSIMVSEIMCACHGSMRVAVTPELQLQYPGLKTDEILRSINPGKGRHGYLCNSDLIEQVEQALLISRILHPGCVPVFAFDNAPNHHAYKTDDLKASKLNLGDGGKNVPFLRNGWVIRNGIRLIHSMQFVDEKGVIIQKGVKRILQERGIWKDGETLEAARVCLNSEPDFSETKEWLQETIENSGGRIIYYPRFHCEYNWIELYWGTCKRYSRKNCDYSWKGLVKTVPLALQSVSLATMKRYQRISFRYMDAYRAKGGKYLTMKQVEWAVKSLSGIVVSLILSLQSSQTDNPIT